MKVLDKRQREIQETQRIQIQRLIDTLSRWEADQSDLEHLRNALRQLDELFLLVVVGEFNSGKSALINALLGSTYLAVGVTPTTDRIHVIKYGEAGPPEYSSEDVRVLYYPAPFLEEINIVDTPGTNAVLRRHEAIARDFVPRSDLVIFVTSADRPFTESERAFLEHIQGWGKKVVVVINKVDILNSPDQLAEVLDFVQDQVKRLLEMDPIIFPLSAQNALIGPASNGETPPGSLEEGFVQFHQFLLETLSTEEKVRLKLLNPLGVASKIGYQYNELAKGRLKVLAEDVKTLEKVEQDLHQYEADTQNEFERRLALIDTQLLEMRIRGEEFIDDRMRLLKVREMLNTQRLRQAFEQEVVGDTSKKIEGHVHEVIDWLVEHELRQWRLITESLEHRIHGDSLKETATGARGSFVYNRRQLLESLGAQSERVIEKYDRAVEAERLAATVQESVALAGLVEVGAVGLGIILKALLVGATADATGILAAGVLGVLGLAIIPFRRGKAKRELRTKMAGLRSELRKVLSTSLQRELERSATRLREAFTPYRRFVLTEQEKLQGIARELDEVDESLQALHHSINAQEKII